VQTGGGATATPNGNGTATPGAAGTATPSGDETADGFCDLRGYRSKIEIPPGLAWVPRVPPCETEVPASPPGTSLCTSDVAGSAIHAVSSPAIPILVTHGSVLVEIDVRCDATGDYLLTLPTLASDPNGTVYFDFSGSVIPVTSASAASVHCSEGAGNVDPGGGTVDTGAGDLVEARLDIAPAALSGATMITIDPEPASIAPPLADTFNNATNDPVLVPDAANIPVLLPQVFDFGPDGLSFLNLASKLTFTYQDAAITNGNEESIGVLHFDGATGRWEQLPVIDRDPDNNTIAVNVVSFSIYGIYEPITQDTDSDGCRDIDELRTAAGSQMGGGRRNPLFFWDFFDTPTGVYPQFQKDRAIAAADVFSVVTRFGKTGNPNQNPLEPVPPPPTYHPAFDRTGALVPPDQGIWNTRWPDGAVSSVDIFSALASFGHACAMP
jgi:hypothetical protein